MMMMMIIVGAKRREIKFELRLIFIGFKIDGE
jgi:hypothetical protein